MKYFSVQNLLILIIGVYSNEEIQIFKKHFISTIKTAIQNENLTNLCAQQLTLFVNELQQEKMWALKMFDAQTKFPSGILFNSLYDTGNFEECIGVKEKNVSGKFCLALQSINIVENVTFTIEFQLGAGLHFSTCLPETCTIRDTSILYPQLIISERNCHTKKPKSMIDKRIIYTIAILSAFVGIAVLSTFIDVYYHYKKSTKKIYKLLTVFSYNSNGKILLTTEKRLDQLTCLEGMKTISMMWIILSHAYCFKLRSPQTDFSLYSFFYDPKNMFITEGSVAVDTFLLIGGLLLTHSFLKYNHSDVKFNLLKHCFHRYMRLTPVYLTSILIYANILTFLGSGLFWNAADHIIVEPCFTNWWTNLLYIQNYVNSEAMCISQSWYLSIDMQLYILSSIMLLMLKKHPKILMYSLLILILLSIPVTFVVGYTNKLRAFIMLNNKVDSYAYFTDYYYKTHTRYAPYFIGIILGYSLHQIKSGQIKIKLQHELILILWVFSVCGCVFCVYGGAILLRDSNFINHCYYLAFIRIAWSISITGVIFLCSTGYGGPINLFLSCSVFQVLSKLTYCMFLLHYPILNYLSLYETTSQAFSHTAVLFDFWGQFVLSALAALIVYLTIELPFVLLEKSLMQNLSNHRKYNVNKI